VETVLYDLKSEKLIWMGRMEIDLEKNLNSMMKKSIDEAVKELKAQGFI
jgi:hypothetical protein